MSLGCSSEAARATCFESSFCAATRDAGSSFSVDGSVSFTGRPSALALPESDTSEVASFAVLEFRVLSRFLRLQSAHGFSRLHAAAAGDTQFMWGYRCCPPGVSTRRRVALRPATIPSCVPPGEYAPHAARGVPLRFLGSVGGSDAIAAGEFDFRRRVNFDTVRKASLVPSGFHAVNLRNFPKFTAFFGQNHRDLLVSPSVATLATVAPCFAPRFSLHGAAILKTNHYDDDEQQHFPRGTALSPFQDSLAAALQHDERVVGSPRSVCTTA